MSLPDADHQHRSRTNAGLLIGSTVYAGFIQEFGFSTVNTVLR